MKIFPPFPLGRVCALLPSLLLLSILFTATACTRKSDAIASAESRSPKQHESIALGGSTTVDPIIQLAIENFQSAEGLYQLSYDGVGSSNGVKGVLNGSYALGGSSRDLKQSEIDAGIKKIAIGRDGMAVATHPSTGVNDLSSEQIAAIFTGKIMNWQEINDKDAPIVVFIREESSGTRASFDELALDKERPVSSALVVVSNGDMALKLSTTPNSIGYIGLGYVSQLENGASPIFVDGKPATEESIISGSYPLARELYILYTGELDGFKLEFRDFLLASQGQDLVVEAGFLPIN